MIHLKAVIEVVDGLDGDLTMPLAELRSRLGGDSGFLLDPRGGGRHFVSLEGLAAGPEALVMVSFRRVRGVTAEEGLLVRRIPPAKARALTFEQLLEEGRGRTLHEELHAMADPPTLRRLRAELGRLVAEGEVERLGSGGLSDPYRYWSRPR